MQEKLEQANNMLVRLQAQISSDRVEQLSEHQQTLEKFMLLMQEILSASDEEKLAHKEQLISLMASLESCLSSLKTTSQESRSAMQKLMQNMKLQQSYGKGQ